MESFSFEGKPFITSTAIKRYKSRAGGQNGFEVRTTTSHWLALPTPIAEIQERELGAGSKLSELSAPLFSPALLVAS